MTDLNGITQSMLDLLGDDEADDDEQIEPVGNTPPTPEPTPPTPDSALPPPKVLRDKRGKWLPGTASPFPRHYQGPARVDLLRAYIGERGPELVEKTLQLALQGDLFAIRLCLERIVPKLRDVAPTVSVPALATAPTLADQGREVIAAVGRGELAPDLGSMLLAGLGGVSKLVEFEELVRRIEQLEKRHD